MKAIRNRFSVPFVITALIAALAGAGVGVAQDIQPSDRSFLDEDLFARIKARSVGPVNFGGRIIDFAVDEQRPATFYVATGSGGIFKTVNNGISFTPVFDDQPVMTIGDIAIAPSDPKVLYVGTGEANNQRSSYWGNGVYKSIDAGKTWQHVGLKGTEHIGRIVVHPRNPDIVYVAALGALYSANKERGLYRTKDGGKAWECVKFLGEDVGFVDVAIDLDEPRNLYAASYERRRRAWNISESGPGSGIWRTSDGGDTWTRCEGGLPSGEIGRIGLDTCRSNPAVVFAVVENNNPAALGTGIARPAIDGAAEDASIRRDGDPDRESLDLADPDLEPAAAQDPQVPNRQDRQAPRRRVVGGEIYRSGDRGKTWKKAGAAGGSPGYYYGQIRVDPQNDQRLYVLGVPASMSEDGGKTWKADFGRGLHVDHHALWLDPRDSAHVLLGNDGGFAQSWDMGKHWDAMNELPIGQFYAIGVDLRTPYWIYGGLQDNGTWGIPSQGKTTAGLSRSDAVRVNGGDGFYVCVDPTDANWVYSESQFGGGRGGIARLHLGSGQRRNLRPASEQGTPALRFNWMSPILISPHDSRTIYFASQYVHRSRNRGDRWETISPDLTTADQEKLKGDVPHCTITTIDESPKQSGLLYAGTDDGKVWVTKNGGTRWTELQTASFPGLPRALWVSRVHCSPHDAAVAYVTFTGYREDHRKPYLYLTTDGGETFRSLAKDLPESPINVVREHPRNKSVVFVGQENGCMVSIDAGVTWHRLAGGMPRVPVHDLVVHPREMDLIVGTHGRGIYVLDIAALEKIDTTLTSRALTVFPPRDGRLLRSGPNRGFTGARGWTGRNPELNPQFSYFLNEEVDGPVTIEVRDVTDRVLFTQPGSTKAGLHQVVWNIRDGGGRGGRGPGGQGQGQGQGLGFGQQGQGQPGGQASQPQAQSQPQGQGPGPGQGTGSRPDVAQRPTILAGQYLLRITHGTTKVDQPFEIVAAPDYTAPTRFGDDEQDQEAEAEAETEIELLERAGR